MKTYAEKFGLNRFDWNKALESMLKGDYSAEKHGALITKAASWVTCACGNQCDIIPRGKEGDPLDKELRWMGNEFYCRVRVGSWEEAKQILVGIEERSAEIIAELTAKQQTNGAP